MRVLYKIRKKIEPMYGTGCQLYVQTKFVPTPERLLGHFVPGSDFPTRYTQGCAPRPQLLLVILKVLSWGAWKKNFEMHILVRYQLLN